jgi:hypothetical protein
MYPDLSPFFGTTIADSTPIKATLLDCLSVALPHHQKSIGIINTRNHGWSYLSNPRITTTVMAQNIRYKPVNHPIES